MSALSLLLLLLMILFCAAIIAGLGFLLKILFSIIKSQILK